MNRKAIRNIVIALLLFGAAAAIYVYKEYNRKMVSIAEVSTDYTISDTALISAFTINEKAAHAKYIDKALHVTGQLKAIDKDEKGNYTLVLGDSASLSSVRCSMDSTFAPDKYAIRKGGPVQIKGRCTGFTADELLGADLILNRCVVYNN